MQLNSRRVFFGAFVVLLGGLSGCHTLVSPPREVKTPTTVWLIEHYGDHHAMLMPPVESGRAGERDWVLLTFGDERVYARNGLALHHQAWALFVPTPGVMGRQDVRWDGQDQAAVVARMHERFVRMRPIVVERHAAAKFRIRADKLFAHEADLAVYNPRNGLVFVSHPTRYGIWHTCNHQVAAWLDELGCDVGLAHAQGRFRVETTPGE